MKGHRLARIAQRRVDLEKELARIVAEIEKDGVHKIILFGSLAKKGGGLVGDIDLIVIRDTKDRFLDRLDRAYRRLRPRMALDLLIYTPEEIDEMMTWSCFVRRALKEGKVLYEAKS